MTPAREHELLTAAADLLREVGYEALSMEGVAARARCSKVTLYRLWSSKPRLVAAAIRELGSADLSEIDTGSLRGDLIAGAEAVLSGQSFSTVAAVHNAARTNAELDDVLRAELLDPGAEFVNRFVERAVRRGELDHHPAAAAYLPHLLFSFFGTTRFFATYPLTLDDFVRYIDSVVMPALLNS